MTRKEFEFILAARIRAIKETLGDKGREYASSTDQFHTFKSSAELQNETSLTTPAREAWGMVKKHIISVQDIVYSDELPTIELLNEKVGDTICYLINIEAILKEEIDNAKRNIS